jgi:hypothetical protein
MFHFVLIICTCRTEDTPAFSAGNYDVSAKALCCEVRHYHCQNFGSDLSNFSPSWKGHNKLSQKGDSWSSGYRRSDEDVNSAFHFTGYFRWLTFSFIKQMEDVGWVPQRSTIVVTQCMSHKLMSSVLIVVSVWSPSSLTTTSGTLRPQYYRRFQYI